MIKIAIAFGVLVTATLIMKKPGMSYRQSVLKTLYPAIMWSSKSSGKKQILANKNNAASAVSFYTLTVKDINGNEFKFSDLTGKKVLIVNTASNCGYTGQYEANTDIASFCKKNYGVTFPLMEKSMVIKGHDQNEVHKWLSDMTINGWCHQEPAWNFCKYLVNEQGVLTQYFPMTVDPLAPEVISAIKAN